MCCKPARLERSVALASGHGEQLIASSGPCCVAGRVEHERRQITLCSCNIMAVGVAKVGDTRTYTYKFRVPTLVSHLSPELHIHPCYVGCC